MKNLLTLLLLSISLFRAVSAQEIKLNQIGFYPDAEKIAIVPEASFGNFEIISPDGNTVHYTSTLDSSLYWSHSDENVRQADFSEFVTPGRYKVRVSGIGLSEEFIISSDVHDGLSKAALKTYYFQRATQEISSEHGGIYARALGHPDNVVYVHASAATAARPTGTAISAPKGWYDAGDFNKYVVNSGISTYTLMAAYEAYRTYYDSLELNIPESGNAIPDILDEVKWNLDWLLAMQDPNDGGVYHKLTTTNFSGFVMPDEATATRYVVQKSTGATYDFAALMAVAYRIFREYETEFPGYAQQCLDASIEAWNWTVSNPSLFYNQATMNSNFNPNINTGEYGDWSFADEKNWAAGELYIATKADSFYTIFNTSDVANTPSWQDVSALPWISLVNHRDSLTAVADTTLIKTRITNAAASLRTEHLTAAYRTPMGDNTWDFVWGSNGTAGNQGMMLLQAFKLSGDTSYLNAALSNLDYMLGRNPTGYSFVAGYGDKTPYHFHHRVSSADGIEEPVPGLIAGGPQPGQEDECPGYPSNLPALSYLDATCSYSTSEVTINWNAPLVFVAGGIENYFGSPSNSKPIITKQPISVSSGEGGDVSFSVNATGQAPLSYQWQFNGTNIATDTNFLSLTSISGADTGSYRVIVSNGLGYDTSDVVMLNLLTQLPYHGTPIAVPGVIEAEDYDLGGEGLAYHDVDGGNNGGAYRTDNVDVSSTGDLGGGFNVGWVSNGEWLEYTVDVDSTAYYFLKFRVATAVAGGLIDMYFDSVQVVNDVYVASTGGWTDFVNLYVDSVQLSAGEQIAQLYFPVGPVNINFVEVSAYSYDCNGDANGLAVIDSCGTCAEGLTGVVGVYDPNNCAVGVQGSLEDVALDIYPNPSESYFTISIDGEFTKGQVTVLDVYGRKMETFNVSSGFHNFGAGYEPGFYFVIFQNGLNTITKRIVRH